MTLASKVIIFSIKFLDQFIIWINPDQNKSQPIEASGDVMIQLEDGQLRIALQNQKESASERMCKYCRR
jgi:hypothetical protein